MSEIQKFFKKIRELNNNNIENYKVIDKLNTIIKENIISMFPQLNVQDTNILHQLSLYLHFQIINKFLELDPKELNLLEQFTQNNNRDIKAIILMLLPFIDDKENAIKFRKLKDLNQLLNSQLGAENISDIEDKDIGEKLIDVKYPKGGLTKIFEGSEWDIKKINW